MKIKTVLFFLLLGTAPVYAQKNWPLSVPKHSTVVLKIANSEMKFSKWSAWTNRNSYAALVERDSNNRITVNGRSDWNDIGWPLMQELRVEDVSPIKPRDKDPFSGTQIMLKAPSYNIFLRFASSINDLRGVFDEISFKGSVADFEKTEYYRKDVEGRFFPRFFAGKMSGLTDKFKLYLLKTCEYESKCFGEETYKEKEYMVVRGKLTDFVLNSSKLSQMQRVSWVFNERLLNALKVLQDAIQNGSAVYHGVKVEYGIPYRNLIDNTGEGMDTLMIYASMADIRLFKDFEITGQELMDRSVVIVGNNRIKVDLNLQY